MVLLVCQARWLCKEVIAMAWKVKDCGSIPRTHWHSMVFQAWPQSIRVNRTPKTLGQSKLNSNSIVLSSIISWCCIPLLFRNCRNTLFYIQAVTESTGCSAYKCNFNIIITNYDIWWLANVKFRNPEFDYVYCSDWLSGQGKI